MSPESSEKPSPGNHVKPNHDKPFKVLCIDGGGIRGLYSAMVLHTIARRFALQRGVRSIDVGKGFDLIAGTSTRGILACCLAAGLSTHDTVNLYREVGPNIFHIF